MVGAHPSNLNWLVCFDIPIRQAGQPGHLEDQSLLLQDIHFLVLRVSQQMEEEHRDEYFPFLLAFQTSSPSSPPPQLPQKAGAPQCQLDLESEQGLARYPFQSQIRSSIDPQENYSSPQ